MAGGRHAVVKWSVPPNVIAEAIEKNARVFRETLDANMSEVAGMGEAFAKANHIWQNRTGQAEATFQVVAENGGLRLIASHGVPYGIYLEFSNGGVYAVIPMVMSFMTPLVQEAMQDSLAAASFGGW